MNTKEAIEVLIDHQHWCDVNHGGDNGLLRLSEALTNAIEHMRRRECQGISNAPDGWRLTEKQQIVWDWATSQGLTLLADDCNDLLWRLLIIENKPVVMAAYPIESAPHDGTPVIAMLFGDDGTIRWASKARYGRDRGDRHSHWYDGMNERLIQPTHWIPTPKVKP